MDITFREVIDDDLEFIREIFNHYITNTLKNYRIQPLKIDELREILQPGHPKYKSILILESGKACGFIYLSQFRKREAYDRTAEITLYLKPGSTGKGLGKEAVNYMEGIAGKAGIKVLVGMIGADNKESISFFTSMGYQQSGHFREVAEKFGRIIDMVVLQKILNGHH
jgi:L-amino acid N-acyltransferase YncA